MSRIHFIRAEHPAGRYHLDGKPSFFHLMDLSAGGLCTQQHIAIDIESILLILCRMIGRDVQSFEIIIVLFDLGTLHHFISHSDEDPLEILQSDGVGMHVSQFPALCRQGDIYGLYLKSCIHGRSFQIFLCLIYSLLYDVSGLIDQSTHLGPFLLGNILHALQDFGQLTLLSGKGYSDIIQCIQCTGVFDRLQCSVSDLIEIFFSYCHICSFQNKKKQYPGAICSRYHPFSHSYAVTWLPVPTKR